MIGGINFSGCKSTLIAEVVDYIWARVSNRVEM